ncbi:MAG TPA: hypothetical protein VJ869_08630, partial [Sphaerochaeta sp.]|nr:hypothetical protein [Sphaerochaeta sp.]
LDMNSNIVGLVASFAFLGAVIVFAFVLGKKTDISSETMRKIIHIGVSNWWFLEISLFTTLSYALVGPIFFIISNSLFTFLDWGRFIGMNDRKRNYGLIYFPVTLLLLVVLQYQGVLPSIACTIGVLVMGYGDGLAALIGRKWGKRKLNIPSGGKTWLGTVVMLLVSFLVTFIGLLMTSLPLGSVVGVSLLVGAVSAFVEAITPLGLDNLSVPLLAAFIVGVFV